jgi:hypothetical protein
MDCRVPITDSGPARFGTLFHAALEQWWLAYQLVGEERLVQALAAFGRVDEAHGDTDMEDLVIAIELMRGYHLRWQHEPLQTLLVEEEFTTPLVNPATGRPSRTYELGGKIDAYVLDERDLRKYLVEHKTTTSDISEGSNYWRRLRLDGQVSMYYGAFPEAAGCIYDVIHRPLQRRYKATPVENRKYTAKGALYASQRADDEPIEEFRTRVAEAIAAEPDSYFKRGVVVRLESEMREHQFDVWQQANLLREMTNDAIYPRNPDSCVQFNRTCDYFDVCTGVASIDDDRLFQVRAQHPELSKETR